MMLSMVHVGHEFVIFVSVPNDWDMVPVYVDQNDVIWPDLVHRHDWSHQSQ